MVSHLAITDFIPRTSYCTVVVKASPPPVVLTIGQDRTRSKPVEVVIVKSVYLAGLLPEVYIYMIVSIHTYAPTSVLMLS